jgi:hypothetical protein
MSLRRRNKQPKRTSRHLVLILLIADQRMDASKVDQAVLEYRSQEVAYPAQTKIAVYSLAAKSHDPLFPRVYTRYPRVYTRYPRVYTRYRASRFHETEEEGILYRPDIVQAMKDIILSRTGIIKFGIIVKGPHGIGKSHSLVNLVRSLRSDGHIVTFIPDCENWDNSFELVEAICGSLGTTTAALGIPDDISDAATKLFVKHVADSLATRNEGKPDKVQWILVFDQLNRIFGRHNFERLKDVGVLPLPFKLMKTLNTFPHTHTVVSASTNNSSSYREHHEGFEAYEHPLVMTDEEIKTWKPGDCSAMDQEDFEDMIATTGGCPLQISSFLQLSNEDYLLANGAHDVLEDTRKLLSESGVDQKEEITKHAVYCLLNKSLTSSSIAFDKKYTVRLNGLLHPIFPAVLIAYRTLFWDDLMEYVGNNEASILNTCANTNVTNDVRGRLFELIVISRLRKQTLISNDPAKDVLPGSVDAGLVFEGQELPTPSDMHMNKLFIPKNAHFPAVDFITKEGSDVWAFQVHVADHNDVEPTFRAMCEEKGWFNAFENIYLVYLSPSPEVTGSLTCLPATPTRVKRPRLSMASRPPIQVSAISKEDVECLKDIQWPAPGSTMEEGC